jgi:hypothetical protein
LNVYFTRYQVNTYSAIIYAEAKKKILNSFGQYSRYERLDGSVGETEEYDRQAYQTAAYSWGSVSEELEDNAINFRR